MDVQLIKFNGLLVQTPVAFSSKGCLVVTAELLFATSFTCLVAAECILNKVTS